MPLKGACLCGAIELEVKDAVLPLKPAVCHCKNCQTTAGSILSVVVPLPGSSFAVTSGTPATYVDTTTDSGNPMHRCFCAGCGSPVFSVHPSDDPDALHFVKYGLFASELAGKLERPGLEIYTKNRNDWLEPIKDAAQQ